MMQSRALGGGRRLALVGAIILIVGCLLPWYTFGGSTAELPATTWSVLSNPAGLLVVLGGLGTLALIALPYAMRPRPVALDRGVVFAVLAGMSLAGVILWVPTAAVNLVGLLPTGAPGFWLALLGAILLCRAAFEISREPPRRL
jgi:hypothetical protein